MLNRYLLPLILLIVQSFPLIAEGPASEPLLDIGRFAVWPESVPDQLRVVSFNLHGPPGDKIEAVRDALRESTALKNAAVFCLQEVNRDHAPSGNVDVGRYLAEALEMDYAYAVELEHESGGGVRGLAILSRYPLNQIERFILPVEGPGGRRRISLGATVTFGEKKLRIYNLHLETRISTDERGEQIQAIIDHSRDYESLPLLVIGDFNTWNGGSRRRMFDLMTSSGFESALDGSKTTFRRAFFVRLKLDWIWTKGFEVLAADVDSDIRVSDHFPLWLDFGSTLVDSR